MPRLVQEAQRKGRKSFHRFARVCWLAFREAARSVGNSEILTQFQDDVADGLCCRADTGAKADSCCLGLRKEQGAAQFRCFMCVCRVVGCRFLKAWAAKALRPCWPELRPLRINPGGKCHTGMLYHLATARCVGLPAFDLNRTQRTPAS